MHRRDAIVHASALTALLLAGCAGQGVTHLGAWPSDPRSVSQTVVVTPGMKKAYTPLAQTDSSTGRPGVVVRPTSNGEVLVANVPGIASTPGTKTTVAPSPAPAPTEPAFEITSSTPVLPIHPHATDLGALPDTRTQPQAEPTVPVVTGQVDETALFRPTTAQSETLEPSTPNVSRVSYAEEGADFDPALSRDGQWLVYASTAHRASSDIYIKRVDSRVVTQLTNDPARDMSPRFSPDGSKIAFASDRSGNWDIYVMPADGGRPVQVTFDPADEIAPSWSSTGDRLVYSRMGESTGRWEMWIAGLSRPEVATFIGYGLFPQWCPTPGTGQGGADRILFQVGRERGRRTFAIWTIDITEGQAGNASEIRSSSDFALINPSWSPDGNWMVFAEVPVAVGESRNNPLASDAPAAQANALNSSLWLVSVENEAPVRLTFGNRLALSPVWSRTNRLYFVSDQAGVENIWSLDMSKPLATAQSIVGSPLGDTFATENDAAPAVDENQRGNR